MCIRRKVHLLGGYPVKSRFRQAYALWPERKSISVLLSNDELFRAELENLELDSPEMLPSTIEEIRGVTKGDPTLSVLCEFSPHVRESKAALDSEFHALDSGFQELDSSVCQWNLDSGF